MLSVSKIDSYATPRRLIAVSSVILLASCATYQKDHMKVGDIGSDYRTKHEIQVQQSETFEDMIVTRDMKGMSLRQHNTALAFIDRFKRSGAKTMRVMVPRGSHNATAASKVAKGIVSLMKKERIPASNIDVSTYNASNHGHNASLRLSYTTVVAGLNHKCGEWKEDLTQTHENNNYSNFGCATQNNLASMIANPEDLISPRGQSEIDATRRDTVITDWRNNGTADLPQILP